MSSFFKWANCEGYIPTNPCANIRAIKYQRKQRGHLSDVEMEMLREACVTLRDKAMIEFMYSTGCRVSELISVKISDVDFDKGEVLLFGKGSKYRTSYLNARAKILMKEYLLTRNDDSPFMFVTLRKPYRPLTKSAVENKVKNLGKDAGIQQKVFPHLIRHTTATLGLQRGMNITDIQRMLGHERVDTTLIYAKVADEAVKESHKKCIV